MGESELEQLVNEYGEKKAVALLKQEIARDRLGGVLTIICNEGVHHLPENLKRGEIYIASTGNLDFSSVDKVKKQYEQIIIDLSAKLKATQWKAIYLVPFGHSTLCMQLKLLVFRITRLETIDLFYDGKGNYFDLRISQRDLIIES